MLFRSCIILAAFVIATPGRAVDRLTDAETAEVVYALQALSVEDLQQQYGRIAKSAGLSEELLRPGVMKASCALVLSWVGASQTYASRIRQAVQSLSAQEQAYLKMRMIEKKSWPQAALDLMFPKLLFADKVTALPLANYLPAVAQTFHTESIADSINRQLAEDKEKTQTTVEPPVLFISRLEESQGQGHIGVDFRLVYSNKEVQSFSVSKLALNGTQSDERVARFALAAIYHRELLGSDRRFRQEINVLAYNLKKLLRVGDPRVVPQIPELLKRLPEVSEATIQSPAKLGFAFNAYLDVKSELIRLGQLCAQSVVQEKKDEKKAEASGVQPPENSKVGGPRVRNPMRVRPMSNSSGGRYYVPYYRDNDTYDLATMCWIMNPEYMLTHPWFWGMSDQSGFAPFLLFGMLEDQPSRAYHTQEVFDPNTRYNMDHFNQPVNPIYLQGNDQPVADPWNPPDRSDIIEMQEANGEIGWQNLEGQSVLADSYTLNKEWTEFEQGSGGQWEEPKSETEDATASDSSEDETPTQEDVDVDEFDQGSSEEDDSTLHS